MRRLVPLSLVVAATFALTGCVAGAPTAATSGTAPPIDPQRLILTYIALPEGVEPIGSGESDSLKGVTGDFPAEQGTLTHNAEGCVGIDLRTGFEPIAFPSGANVLPDGSGVIVPLSSDGEMGAFTFGSRLEAGGKVSPNLAVDLSAACEAESLAAVRWD